MTTTHWKDYYHGNYPKAVEGAICAKASEGVGFKDSTFGAWQRKAAAGGHHFMAYHAIHPGSTSDMKDQAHLLFSVVGKKVPCMYDVEKWPKQSGSPAGIVNLSQLHTAIEEFRSLGGQMFVNYLPKSQWGFMGNPNLESLEEEGIHILNANYDRGNNKPGCAALKPYGGITPFANQYAACNNFAPMTWDQAWDIWTGAKSNAPAPKPTTHAPGSREIKQGDQGVDVKFIQSKLSITQDGDFGPNTNSHVRTWQHNHRLAVDGIVGKNTWASFGVKVTYK